jgi:penicillin-binding protein 1A
VVKSLLLTNEVSLVRKIEEGLLALRIERPLQQSHSGDLSQRELLYLGCGAHGVAEAALNYFNKSVDELTIEEAAFLPKAPSHYNPSRSSEAAKARRDWVIDRHGRAPTSCRTRISQRGRLAGFTGHSCSLSSESAPR